MEVQADKAVAVAEGEIRLSVLGQPCDSNVVIIAAALPSSAGDDNAILRIDRDGARLVRKTAGAAVKIQADPTGAIEGCIERPVFGLQARDDEVVAIAAAL